MIDEFMALTADAESAWKKVAPWLRRLGYFLLLTLISFAIVAEWLSEGRHLSRLDSQAASQLTGPIGWPLAAIILVLVMRNPLAQFLSAFAARASRVSFLQIEITLNDIPAPAIGGGPAMYAIRDAEASRLLGDDSSQELVRSFAMEAPAEVVTIDLGDGKEWLSSRLYIYTAILRRFKSLRYVAFVRTKGRKRRFVGLADAAVVETVIGERFWWLKEVLGGAFDRSPGRVTFREPTDLTNVEHIVAFALHELQTRRTPWASGEWVELRQDLWERAQWLDRHDISDWFGDDFRRRVVPVGSDEAVVVGIAKASGDIVAVAKGNELHRLVDRRVTLNAIARQWADATRSSQAA